MELPYSPYKYLFGNLHQEKREAMTKNNITLIQSRLLLLTLQTFTSFIHDLLLYILVQTLPTQDFWDTKVTNLNNAMRSVQQNVVWLNVSMKNFALMNMQHSKHQLTEEVQHILESYTSLIIVHSQWKKNCAHFLYNSI